ncbi:MAG: hypothetical protein EOP82_08450 [Variovorax sp.]|nr:MAG: hypothetical protein EOP82_08450 [Variovorax sp.]
MKVFRRFSLCGVCLLAFAGAPVQAERTTATAPSALSAQARLDFTVNIGKFVYLRIGQPGATANLVEFAVTPSIPSAPTTPVTGNNRAVNWNGAAPAFAVNATGNALQVDVKSNAGAVSLQATALTPLVSGSNSIPLSRITIASDSANLPAPPIPDTGTGISSTVSGGGAFSSLVTDRSAMWTFTYAPTAATSPPAGVYDNGQVRFTASVP